MRFFEHIIRIGGPGIDREGVGEELLEYARHPERYVPGLSKTTIDEESVDGNRTTLRRTTRFGTDYVFRETVTIERNEVLEIATAAGSNHPASRHTVRIEEPEAGALFLRFIYDQDTTAEADPRVDALRRDAYAAKDQDVVGRMLERLIARRGN